MTKTPSVCFYALREAPRGRPRARASATNRHDIMTNMDQLTPVLMLNCQELQRFDYEVEHWCKDISAREMEDIIGVLRRKLELEKYDGSLNWLMLDATLADQGQFV